MPVTASNDSIGSHLSGVFGRSLSRLIFLLPLTEKQKVDSVGSRTLRFSIQLRYFLLVFYVARRTSLAAVLACRTLQRSKNAKRLSV